MTEHQPAHNYVRKLEALVDRGILKPGRAFDLDVWHESDCGSHAGLRCDCDALVLVSLHPARPEPAPDRPPVPPSAPVAGVPGRAGEQSTPSAERTQRNPGATRRRPVLITRGYTGGR
ncbi:MAG TPA: hypothetical protein VKE74_17515 [Gemmataceae bacterium]|nr:hypothetical protein [Gemmataceae bacterium]